KDQTHRRSFDADVLGGGDAALQFQRDVEPIVRGSAAAKIARARQRSTLEPAQQLFDVKSGQRAVERRQGCGAIERIGQRVDARSGTFHQEIQVALAFDAANADQVPQALFQIDVAELHLRFELGAFIQFGDRNRSGYEAAERLRLPNGEGQVAGTEVSRD